MSVGVWGMGGDLDDSNSALGLVMNISSTEWSKWKCNGNHLGFYILGGVFNMGD